MQIPTTRAISPKLGRRKTSAGKESKESSGHSLPLGRLSLDTVDRNNPAKAQSLANPRKPIRKSLPKLPSEKTSLSTASAKTTNPSKIVAKEEITSNIAGAEENSGPSAEASALTSLSQGQEQAIAVEH